MDHLQIGDITVEVPIIQGGMGVGISLSGLASAVANEGGIGVISSAGLGLLYRDHSADFEEASIYGLRREIRKARENTKGILGVNIMIAMSNFSDMVKTSMEEGIDVIFVGAGLPLDLPSYRSPGCRTRLVPIVSSGRAARIILDKWFTTYRYLPDAIVVEGPEAGGHLGFKNKDIFSEDFKLEKLVADVLAETNLYEARTGRNIAVIAAGGIYTGSDIFRMFGVGASAVQMGTRFVTTHECDASVIFKQAYLSAEEKDIGIINSPVGMPGRAIINTFIEKIRQGKKVPLRCPFKCIRTCDVTSSPYCIISALFNAFRGNLESGFAFAGSNAFRAERIMSVSEVFYELTTEFTATAKKISNPVKSIL